ncbi:MAG: cysteine--tRNA ligase [Holosporaceae bacterium]|jgi:cysteinyl-tRNA synthetase|nr:cysteine--tRNA ligase [Holosporaceae bacterium]
MKELKLYNSLSNSLEVFVPLDEANIRMYVCGPTVYASPHVGNARPLVIFDVLYRVLMRLYPRVVYVRNITDVDDKINARARIENISIKELTSKIAAEFHANLELLRVLPVTLEPKATEHIHEMLEIIERLIANGFAYEAAGHVLFSVKKLPNYGMLSKRTLDEMIAGSRVEVAAYKEDPMDFVLWKPAEPGSPAFDSKYGKGRPGWHIECSAMSHKYLGPQFDIHAGGQDLLFPHHENEVAQNFGAFGCLMAKHWIHNGMLLVDGQKMSKSLGNIIALNDILKKHDGEVVRYVLLGSHYQKTLNWTDQIVTQSKYALDKLYNALRRSSTNENISLADEEDVAQEKSEVLDALCENLNTPLALQKLHKIAEQIRRSDDPKEIERLRCLLGREAALLGLLQGDPDHWGQTYATDLPESEINKLVAERNDAKSKKNFLLADKIRDELLQHGVQVEDTRLGSVWKIVANPSPKK